jgi:hypothetical protein
MYYIINKVKITKTKKYNSSQKTKGIVNLVYPLFSYMVKLSIFVFVVIAPQLRNEII